jgi:hypothetical protein
MTLLTWLYFLPLRYVQKILKTNIEDCKRVSTPSTTEVLQALTEIVKAPYKEVVGALMYFVNASRPDIAYATGKVVRASVSSKREDCTEVKRIFHHLKVDPFVTNRLQTQKKQFHGKPPMMQTMLQTFRLENKPLAT